MSTSLAQRALIVYSAILTITLAVLLLAGFAKSRSTSFDEITVHRLNVVEPDGTLRMVVSNKAEFPGLILKGKEYPHDRQTAGMLFFDDEGSENGGLIFGGAKDENGKVATWGHLSFDQYLQDQVFAIDAGEENGQRQSIVRMIDEPDYPITDIASALRQYARLAPDQRQQKVRELTASKGLAHTRLELGRTQDRSVGLRLKDAEGRDRLVLLVRDDGTPMLQFLDASGKVVNELPK